VATRRSTFSKLQRDRDKKAKAAAKRERRLDRSGTADEPAVRHSAATEHDAQPSARLLELIEQVHRQYDSRQIGHDEFEERKAALLAQLRID
jgi:hypothetical protein